MFRLLLGVVVVVAYILYAYWQLETAKNVDPEVIKKIRPQHIYLAFGVTLTSAAVLMAINSITGLDKFPQQYTPPKTLGEFISGLRLPSVSITNPLAAIVQCILFAPIWMILRDLAVYLFP